MSFSFGFDFAGAENLKNLGEHSFVDVHVCVCCVYAISKYHRCQHLFVDKLIVI